MIPYIITQVQWNFTSSDIIKVQYYAGYTYYVITLKNTEATIPASVYGLFKEEFPEHCINISEFEDMPF